MQGKSASLTVPDVTGIIITGRFTQSGMRRAECM